MKKNISLVFAVPTYNQPKELYEFLKSLKEQENHNLDVKVIIGDNGNSKDIVDKFINEIDIVYFKHSHNVGAGFNLFFTIKKACSIGADYVWLFGDDLLKKDALKSMEIVLREKIDFMYVNSVTMGKEHLKPFGCGKSGKMSANEFLLCLKTFFTFISGMIFQNDILKLTLEDSKVLNWRKSYWPQVAFALSILKRGKNFYFFEKPLVIYRPGLSSWLSLSQDVYLELIEIYESFVNDKYILKRIFEYFAFHDVLPAFGLRKNQVVKKLFKYFDWKTKIFYWQVGVLIFVKTKVKLSVPNCVKKFYWRYICKIS